MQVAGTPGRKPVFCSEGSTGTAEEKQPKDISVLEPNLEEDAGRYESTAGVEGTGAADVQVCLVEMLQNPQEVCTLQLNDEETDLTQHKDYRKDLGSCRVFFPMHCCTFSYRFSFHVTANHSLLEDS